MAGSFFSEKALIIALDLFSELPPHVCSDAMNGYVWLSRSFPHKGGRRGYSKQASKAGTKKPPGWGGLFVFRLTWMGPAEVVLK